VTVRASKFELSTAPFSLSVLINHLLDEGYTHRAVQMVTKHKDPMTVMRYGRARENLDKNPVNFFSYDEA
jgi:hypothetical protein